MKQHHLTQGSPEWLAYRSTHFNASDAPAMMGVSPYKTRTQLLHELHTWLSPEVDAATQRRFDAGHQFEALARPLAEEFIGQDLYPVVGSEGKLSASFDGLTMCESIAFEHKTLNDNLRAIMVDGCNGADLDMQYQIQMEQQLMVSGAEKCLFMASKWDGDELIEERHCWYVSNATLRQDILQGWTQFAIDLANFVPTEIKEKPRAEASASLPALFIHAKGEITTSNMQEYGVALAARLESVRAIVLITDQDFSNAKEQAKVFRDQREKLQAVKESMLSQTTTIGEAARMIDFWSEDLRLTALKIEKDVEKEDAAKKLSMINATKVKYTEHTAAIAAEILPARLGISDPDFAGAIKGKRNYSSMQDALDVALANGKIAVDAAATTIRSNLAAFHKEAQGYEFLFADLAQLVHKAADDIALVIRSRIDAHTAAEQKKTDELRESIRVEEEAKATEAIAAAQASATVIAQVQSSSMEGLEPIAAEAAALVTHEAVVEIMMPDSVVQAMKPAEAPTTAPTLRLGQMADRLGFTITAALLSEMKFEPSSTDKAAKLYHEAEWPLICAALVKRINAACVMEAA